MNALVEFPGTQDTYGPDRRAADGPLAVTQRRPPGTPVDLHAQRGIGGIEGIGPSSLDGLGHLQIVLEVGVKLDEHG